MSTRVSLDLVAAILFGICSSFVITGCSTSATSGNANAANANSSTGSGDDAAEEVIFNNHNPSSVHNGSSVDTQFTTTQRYRVTSIETYHWNGGTGMAAAGTISLYDSSAALVGTWACTGRAGQGGVPNAYWTCLPEWEIPAGTYTVVDSDSATWSCNTDSGEAGMCIVMGVPISSDTVPDATGDSPETVAKRYLEAQAAGDTQGMLDESALHLMTDNEVAESRAAADVIAQRATLSGFSFTHLATGYDAERTMSMVRCQHEVTVTVNGVSDEQEGGTFFWMVWHDGRWKIRNVFPDELVALALAEQKGLLGEKEQRTMRLYTWQEVSDQFSRELMTATLNTGKLALDVKGSAIGAKPITGDALSWWYTVGDMVVSAKEVVDDAQEGRLKSVFWGSTSVAWGVVQLVAEPFPGFDHASDFVGAGLDQIHNWSQQKETYIAMLSSLKQGDFRNYETYLMLRPQQNIPAGVNFDLAEDWVGDGLALEGITFLTDDAIASGVQLAFDIGALVAVHQDETPTYFARAVFMGAHVSGFAPHQVAYLGAKITDLMIGDERAGANILSPVDAGPWKTDVSYNITAMRGFQTLAAKALGYDEQSTVTTKPVTIENRVFNLVDGIAIGESPETAKTLLQLTTGDTLSGQHIYGTISSLALYPNVRAPRLTMVDPATLTMEDGSVASFVSDGSWPNASLSITGGESGATYLSLHIPTGDASVPALDSAVRIEVEEEPGDSYLPLLKNARIINACISGTATWIYRNCSDPDYDNQVFQDDAYVHWNVHGKANWSGTAFSITDADEPDIIISGTVSEDGRTILTLTATKLSLGAEYVMTANNLPLDESRLPYMMDQGSLYYVVGNHDSATVEAAGHGTFSGREAAWSKTGCEYQEFVSFDWPDTHISVDFYAHLEDLYH